MAGTVGDRGGGHGGVECWLEGWGGQGGVQLLVGRVGNGSGRVGGWGEFAMT